MKFDLYNYLADGAQSDDINERIDEILREDSHARQLLWDIMIGDVTLKEQNAFRVYMYNVAENDINVEPDYDY